MNIFYLSPSTDMCAQFLDDKRLVSMVKETAQMLSTAAHINNMKIDCRLYKPTHTKHPCTIWVAQSHANYAWTLDLYDALSLEYQHRFGKIHACDDYRDAFEKIKNRMPLPEILAVTPRPRCTPGVTDVLNTDHSTMMCYRRYLTKKWIDSKNKPRWTNTKAPRWYTGPYDGPGVKIYSQEQT